MAYSVIPKMRRDGAITLKDQGGAALEISFESGDMTFTPTKDAQFSLFMRQFTDASEAGAVLDFVNKTGHYASNTSTGNTGTPRVEEYCIDIEYSVEGLTHNDDANHKAVLSKCICDVVFTEGDPSTLQVNFVSFGGVTYEGPA